MKMAMAREAESLQIRRFDELPSATDFASQIESRNVPAVFSGCTKDWKALRKWNPHEGGLDYLQERAGPCTVEAMLSRSAPFFYGDLRSHERVPLPFSSFIGFCKQLKERKEDDQSQCMESKKRNSDGSEQDHLAPKQMYLAQVPIMNVENKGRAQLEALWEDIRMPAFLDKSLLASVNLWMNIAEARSSTHYDPHHNLLCIVSGTKKVVLWPPSASPLLYPMPLYGEASNHSSLSLGKPDFSLYPRAEYLMDYSHKVILKAGDALFIPEGWFHQVDSDNLSIAVNFWWQSNLMRSMSEHMDAYYLRRILRRLTDKEMELMLPKPVSGECKVHESEQTLNGDAVGDLHNMDKVFMDGDLKGKEVKLESAICDMEPSALQALHALVSLVHDRVNIPDPSQVQLSSRGNGSTASTEGGPNNRMVFHLEDDPVAKILWNIEPHTLRTMLLYMADKFPRTLEALILHLLSPVGAEALTRKFDEIDAESSEEDRSRFYQVIYGALDDQFAAMDAILLGKESFAMQAFRNVLDKYLGVNIEDGPKLRAR
ncbi:uncharacterized protein LOC115752003 [Rhodamnia argentea]|uniref:Uncharacterized protein LOC115752003 n=1 Tax=Rhodamnia argentea TaxID=178133 RepID=A0A8B8QH53_9MYRT|nr:uncharacterized protein LOC115752003 [Rhodamnia argentea]